MLSNLIVWLEYDESTCAIRSCVSPSLTARRHQSQPLGSGGSNIAHNRTRVGPHKELTGSDMPHWISESKSSLSVKIYL